MLKISRDEDPVERGASAVQHEQSERAESLGTSPGTNEKTDRPNSLAKGVALFSLGTIVTGVIAQALIADRLIVSGDAAATATNILAHRALYQVAFTVFMVEMACQVASTALWYRLLRPVNKTIALVGMAWGLTGAVLKLGGRVFFLAPLFLLSGKDGGAIPHYLGVFSAEQVQALALVFIAVMNRLAGMGLAFFGFGDTLTSWLIFKSTFLPRWLGVMSMVGAVGWTTFAYPQLGSLVFLPLVLYALAFSVVIIGWLLIKGVDEEKWREMARA